VPEERRAHPRSSEKHKLRLKIDHVPAEMRPNTRPFTVWTNDVSYGGLQFTCRRWLPVGTVLKLEVECSRPHEVFRHVGRVVWLRKEADEEHYTIGVYFTETPVRVLNAWGKHLTASTTM